MRADAHYVDQLIAAPSRPAGAPHRSSPAATESKMPSLAAVDAELASSLNAVLSSVSLVGESSTPLSRGVAAEMIRAEVQRAMTTLKAASVLRHGVPEERRLVSPRRLVQLVSETVAADARLRGISVITTAENATGVVSVDEETLVAVLSAVVLTLAGALNRCDGACLTVTATSEPAGSVTIAVEQESVIVPEAWLPPLASTAAEAPGGHRLVALLALRQLADAWGGRVLASRLPHGTRVALELPLAARRPAAG
jgi:signal transduction histidine kinase